MCFPQKKGKKEFVHDKTFKANGSVGLSVNSESKTQRYLTRGDIFFDPKLQH